MLFGARIRRTFFSPLAGLLVALFVLQFAHDFVAPEIFPPLVEEVQAASGTIDPNGDIGTNTGTRFGSCSGTTYTDCVDDGTRSPTTPDITNYVEMTGGQQTDSNMTTLTSVQTVTAVTVNVYHNETRSNMFLSAALVNSAGTIIAGPTAIPYSASNVWSAVPFTGLSLSQATLDGLRVRLTCTNSGNPNRQCNAYAMYADVTYDPVINVTVGSLGNQQNLNVGITSAYVGGTFRIAGSSGSRTLTAVTIAEQGSVDAANDLSNIKLYFDTDTSGTPDCTSESYQGTEFQFGSTQSAFSAADGTVTFSDGTGITISPTQTACMYVVLDVDNTASAGETIELQITDPTTNITVSPTGVISPSTPILLPNTTTLQEVVIRQGNYHWRDDDGSESTATSDTGGVENIPFDSFPKSTTKRLRMLVSNEGNVGSSPIQYRLEYAPLVSTCSVATGWADVGAVGGDFDMSPTGNLTDGSNTTDIAVSIGGVSTTTNVTFLSSNGGVRDTNSQTGGIALGASQFVELEYAIEAASGVADGNSYCFRLTNAGTPFDSTAYLQYPELTIAADLNVGTIGTQAAVSLIPTSSKYAGGAFTVTDTGGGANTITSVTIAASGTVNIQNNLANIRLRYDIDTSDPYDCQSVSYDTGDTQFGSVVGAFNGSNEATFTGSVQASTTQAVCFYVEYDVGSGASNGELLDIRILDPSTDVVVTSSTVAPASVIDIAGVTTLGAPFVEQVNYHWRNDDGNETGATSATGGSENTVLPELAKNSTIRLRFAIGNTGLADSSSIAYQLEWAQKISSCDAATTWERLDTTLDEFEMSSTVNLTNNNDAVNIPVGSGGVSNPANSFLINNDGIKDTDDTTNATVLPSDNWLELEYAIAATDAAIQGATYCFRVTNSGTPLNDYNNNYPEATIRLDTDYRIQRDFAIITGTSTTISVANNDYEAPANAQNAFIRITNTQLTGAGPNTGAGNNNADDVTVYIVDPSTITTSITFARSPFAAGNTRVSWEIIEYTGVAGGENEMIVRRQESVTYSGAATTISGATTNTVVDDNDVVVFITAQYNDNVGRNNYDQGLSTATWNTGTNQADFIRGAGGSDSTVSYALVEFTGSNWNIQRVEHQYSSASSTETEAISPVNSISKAFLHVQKRTDQINHADFGHTVYFSGIGELTFVINDGASSPTTHFSVAWVIENTQTVGNVMDVTPSSGFIPTGGTAPQANLIPIGKTIDDLSVASIFTNSRSDETQRSWPEPILGVRLISATQYELWRSDTSANVTYNTEVVEWPTAARKLTQNDFQIYVDNEELLPADPWPVGPTNLGENAPMTADDEPMRFGSTTRIRMNLTVSASAMPPNLDSFTLQYGELETSCSAVTDWHEVGDAASTTALWRGKNNTPVDGAVLSSDPPTPTDLLLTLSTIAGTYEEENDSALNPYLAVPGDEIEYDWVVQHNGAKDKTSYCFRMIEANGTPLLYNGTYPTLRTVGYGPLISNWRWYDDETSPTPSSPLALENTAATDVSNQNAIKLRVVLREASGADGNNAKFALQFSEFADFSQAVATVTPTSTCLADSLWCYFDGAGTDNGIIDQSVISNADNCVSGVGNGCGSYNEGVSSTTATIDHQAFANTEYEFTILQAAARARAVYYFRLYDVVNNEFVALDSGASYPSLMIEGAQLVFTMEGLSAGTTTAGVVTDVPTTANSINFGSLPFNTSYEAAQRFVVNTNSTEGYQLLTYATQQLLNQYGDPIPPITSTNASPAGWSIACSGSATGCFGYHTTDATLQGGSTRFAPDDSYAALDTVAREVMYSSTSTVDIYDLVYRIQVSELQPAGDYETSLVYVAVPVF